jgi:hypothetical protein
MKPEDQILKEIRSFFDDIFELKAKGRGYKYAGYKNTWLKKIGLKQNARDEAKSARTTKELQNRLEKNSESG